MPPLLSHDTVAGVSTARQGDVVPSRPAIQQPVHSTINRDEVVPGVDVLRPIPSISSAVTQLLAFYDQQAVQVALPGKGHINRRKSLRYNTTDTTLVGPHLRWPNEGLVSASHVKKPAYDELNLKTDN